MKKIVCVGISSILASLGGESYSMEREGDSDLNNIKKSGLTFQEQYALKHLQSLVSEGLLNSDQKVQLQELKTKRSKDVLHEEQKEKDLLSDDWEIVGKDDQATIDTNAPPEPDLPPQVDASLVSLSEDTNQESGEIFGDKFDQKARTIGSNAINLVMDIGSLIEDVGRGIVNMGASIIENKIKANPEQGKAVLTAKSTVSFLDSVYEQGSALLKNEKESKEAKDSETK
jgi:uncharacterized protein YggU (UPF0235/DUF167 family)